jgi:hypothetical protein
MEVADSTDYSQQSSLPATILLRIADICVGTFKAIEPTLVPSDMCIGRAGLLGECCRENMTATVVYRSLSSDTKRKVTVVAIEMYSGNWILTYSNR